MVTPEMIEAGIRAMSRWADYDEMAEEVYLVMERVRRAADARHPTATDATVSGHEGFFIVVGPLKRFVDFLDRFNEYVSWTCRSYGCFVPVQAFEIV